MIGQNKSKVALVTSASAFTSSIQRIYAPHGTEIESIQFGYHERVQQTGSKIVPSLNLSTADLTNAFGATRIKLDSNSTLEGPIISFRITGSSTTGLPVFAYLNNVKL